MFKRIRENPKYQKLKELWKNPKTHSMIVLGFWLVFMLVAILFVRLTTNTASTTPSVDEVETSVSSFADMDNYAFSYVTKDLEINGQVYGEKLEFNLNNHRYYYNGNTYMINGDTGALQEMDLSVLKIDAKMLNSLVEGLTGSEIEDYTQYVIPLDRFISLFEASSDTDLSAAMSYNVVMNVYKNENVISKVILDLTNYRTFRFNDSNQYLLYIYFYNVNKVADFTADYERIVGGI